jgi:hypothetical protein
LEYYICQVYHGLLYTKYPLILPVEVPVSLRQERSENKKGNGLGRESNGGVAQTLAKPQRAWWASGLGAPRKMCLLSLGKTHSQKPCGRPRVPSPKIDFY